VTIPIQPEPDKIARRRVVEAATAILDGHLGITEGSRLLCELALDVAALQEEPAFVVFFNIDSETDAFPLRAVRQHWRPAALTREDEARQRYEEAVRPAAIQACAELIRRYQWPSNSNP
jgi:hypothetical protein